MNTLYRAVAYAKAENDNDLGVEEKLVFVSAINETEAIAKIRIFVSTHWRRSIDTIECYNVKSAKEMIDDSMSPESEDLCWFETGSFDGRPSYGGDTALFFAPEFAERLVMAKHELLNFSK